MTRTPSSQPNCPAERSEVDGASSYAHLVQPADDHANDALARRAAGRAVRQIGHALVGHDASTELLTDVATTLDGLTARLERNASRHRPVEQFGHRQGEATARGAALESYDDRPFSGTASPWGVDLEAIASATRSRPTVTLGAAHEGAPGRAHGGIVAGLFDDVFGFVLGVIQEPAFTGELKVRYERPTPLHRPLLCRGRLASATGAQAADRGRVDRRRRRR